MKLILTADVDHLGSAGDSVEVKDGYGRNFLLPRGLAIVASRGAAKQVEDIRRADGSGAVELRIFDIHSDDPGATGGFGRLQRDGTDHSNAYDDSGIAQVNRCNRNGVNPD